MTSALQLADLQEYLSPVTIALESSFLQKYLSPVSIALQSSLLHEYLSLVRIATQSFLNYQIDENAQAASITVIVAAKISATARGDLVRMGWPSVDFR